MATPAPRRGKFLSAPSTSSPPSAPETPSSSRGKFLGNKPASSPSSAQGAPSSGSNAGDAEKKNDSLDALRTQIRSSKEAAISRRKEIATQRDRVFQDLDEAENIVLSLLECASDVASSLSEMTTAKCMKSHEERGEGGEGDAKQSFEDLTEKVRSNGVGYLAGVKSLHKLLAPHASLVKSYKNHNGKGTDDIETPNKGPATAAQNPVETTKSSKIVEEATSNMYAARVKKRLAMERGEILKEMIRLEALERDDDEAQNQSAAMDTDADGSGPKRKFDSIEQQG